ncbi:MAG: hypothetical protein PHT60_13265 [Acidiphilium sp.]|nr:hypothetical protein [Acidiphilium sp.]MDD4936732.1 hypothetical protein [Acidiphilium sp.]
MTSRADTSAEARNARRMASASMARPSPLALPIVINGQPTKHDGRDCPGHIPAHGADDLMGEDLTHAQGKVANDFPG